MIIAGVLLTVFNNINQETREENINYSQFIREVRSGRVDAVVHARLGLLGLDVRGAVEGHGDARVVEAKGLSGAFDRRTLRQSNASARRLGQEETRLLDHLRRFSVFAPHVHEMRGL